TGGIGFDSVASDGLHTCGLSSGTAYCWGDNASGELGDGSTASRSQPSAVSGSLTFSALAPGWLHTCGLSGGAAYCWGRNVEGQLGSGAPNIMSLPTAVSGGLTFTVVTAGCFHNCALHMARAATCSVFNTGGRLTK